MMTPHQRLERMRERRVTRLHDGSGRQRRVGKRSWGAANVHGCDNGSVLSLCQATG
jgi:hypothetical protein